MGRHALKKHLGCGVTKGRIIQTKSNRQTSRLRRDFLIKSLALSMLKKIPSIIFFVDLAGIPGGNVAVVDAVSLSHKRKTDPST